MRESRFHQKVGHNLLLRISLINSLSPILSHSERRLERAKTVIEFRLKIHRFGKVIDK